MLTILCLIIAVITNFILDIRRSNKSVDIKGLVKQTIIYDLVILLIIVIKTIIY